jgi:hypothetical protein
MLPILTISGSNTGLNYSVSIAIDMVHNEIFVGNDEYGDKQITVYGRTDMGDVAP